MKNKALLGLSVLALSLTSCGVNAHHDMSEYVLSTAYHDNYRILQLTDLHIGDKENQDIHYKFLDLTIKDANADFIVVTGDLFTFASKDTAKRLFAFLDSYQKPWTVVFGNHDEQCTFSVDWLTGYLNEKTSYGLFKDIQDDDVHGNCNFAINLMNGNSIFEQLILMDTNRYYYGDYFGYDFVKPDQIDWYERLIDYTTAQNGGTVVPSTMFYHIPLPEIDDAWDGSQNGDPNAVYEYGEKREDTCPPKYNSGLFGRILAKGSTHAMFFGHDHINNFRVVYKGVTFCYGIKSTDTVYFDEDMMGGQVITLHNDHSLTYEHIYHTYGEVK